VLAGWGDGNMAFPSMFAHLFLPDSTPETRQLYSELQRKSASKTAANLLMQALATLSVFSRLKEIRVPTLVIQVARDQVIDPKLVPGISSAIPGSEFVSIDSANHILLESEPSWRAFTTLFAQRVAGGTGQLRRITDEQPPQFDRLSQREQQILHALAQGMSNRQIADRLRISEKTVRNHVTGIFDKLGVTSRAQAIVLAKESGF
jgi:DNA-binding NarL/FixJ family response regulator